MKKNFMLFTILLFVSFVSADQTWEVKFNRIIDGDTIEINVENLPPPLHIIHVRINGIDTPEKNALAKCEKERILGLKASLKLKELIGNSKTLLLRNVKYDKYGGRILADVYVNHIDIGKAMLESKLAVPYKGLGPKHDWCN